ncbi:MAG: sigma-70 family RNA polymerase sigma factor [Litorimonas sp.]
MTGANKQIQLNAALDLYQAGLAIDGDLPAFDLLYRRWHPRLLRLASRLTGNSDEARDVMQDAALTIARDIHKLRDPARFSAWAYTIVRRRASDYIDRAIRVRKAALEMEVQIAEHDPERALSLRQALSQLPDVDRLMLALFYIDGLRGTEMAAALGIPLGTLKSRLFTARKKLKSIYEVNQGDQND